MAAPVVTYSDDDRRLPRTLRAALEELRRDECERPLLSGTPTDYAAYQFYYGGLRALERAIELCIEAEKKLEG